MSYLIGEKLIAAQIEEVTGFDESNVARGDWRLLNTGNSAHYAIIKRGAVVTEWVAHNISQDNYRTIIEVWQRLKDSQESYDDLLEHVAAIETRIKQYRLLADTAGVVLDANLTGASAMTEQWRNNADGPSWFKIEINIDWSEQTNVTFAE
jgi:hypothetical protein